ncbi:MraY family glycosyltransferase [uncultured Imperialibacter sp.]|uniref:glycosyltransferase family 4 protein n=1 Tax=uncultured Imperialibacter sp. TaxID=1672639 RepID=UPI0030DAFD30|tara:strand:+ start:128950 stop:130113 length:1164 start_codon:yes stop_codon:yes gene_type:complete
MEKILFALTSFLICFILTPAVIYFFVKNSITDTPGGRKIHKGNTPSMGGIPIMIGVLFATLLWFTFGELNQSRSLLFAVSIMFMVGLRDDLVNMSALHKLIGQLAAALLVVFFGGVQLTSLYGLFGVYDLPTYVGVPISIFTIIVLTNAFNLIDGVDGLAGAISLLALTFFGVWFELNGQHLYAGIAATFAGGIVGFLMFNWSPAKIFMGDTGALAIGLLLASFAVLFIESNFALNASSPIKFSGSVATGVAVMILPIFDTARIFVKRVRKGKSPLSPDKSHVHHFIMRMGFEHRHITLILTSINFMFVAIAIVGKSYSDSIMLPIVIGTAIFLGLSLDYLVLRSVKNKVRKSPKLLVNKKFPGAKVPTNHPVVEKTLIETENILQN